MNKRQRVKARQQITEGKYSRAKGYAIRDMRRIDPPMRRVDPESTNWDSETRRMREMYLQMIAIGGNQVQSFQELPSTTVSPIRLIVSDEQFQQLAVYMGLKSADLTKESFRVNLPGNRIIEIVPSCSTVIGPQSNVMQELEI